ncbi:protein of unknown function [Desulfotomaculum arcticum]|uniref:DUF4956 domain-containing protein n=1 Tax=Desulfotruncus arcticus DSM 17038 TaxID=1121424 RepID=A0A1I2W8K2_9FIRM|nr:DUF4956 domain-containing protein [Desulfotruncus arcticus]SFG97632.1 protein of unknown function [Desulfotomaculum arcticum] [Desulfotruncus arcticus DSM 17038]
MLENILSTNLASSITLQGLLICTLASLVLGVGIACIYMYRSIYTKNFVVTLALLPAMVQLVIMLVNGNIGTGVAVMGAFSLVRFRSVPGSAREISSIFLAMAVGLATGMGYLGIAVLFLVIIGSMTVLLTCTSFGEQKKTEKELKITIPESLDYFDIFSDLFQKYTKSAELVKVKTTNMGSLYQLQYHIVLANQSREKEFIDEIRCRNGNLNITCGRVPTSKVEL